MPDWLAILVVFRDVVIVGGVVVLAVLGQPVMIRPLYISKVNTALQIVLVAVALLLVRLRPERCRGDGRPDLGGRRDHAGVRRRLRLDYGAPSR